VSVRLNINPKWDSSRQCTMRWISNVIETSRLTCGARSLDRSIYFMVKKSTQVHRFQYLGTLLFLCARLNIGPKRDSSVSGTTQGPSYTLDPSCLTWAARNLSGWDMSQPKRSQKRPEKKTSKFAPFSCVRGWISTLNGTPPVSKRFKGLHIS